MLNRGQRVFLAGRSMTLRLEGSGPPDCATLELSPPSVALKRHGVFFVLESICDDYSKVTVVARPTARDDRVFPAGTRLHLTLEGWEAHERVMVPGVRADGQGRCPLVVVESSMEGLLIYRAEETPTALSGLSGEAWSEARHLAEASGRLKGREASVLIDDSASMMTNHRGGSVRAVMDVLSGIVYALTPSQKLKGVRVGNPGTMITEYNADELGAAVDRAMAARPASSGFRCLDGGGGGAETLFVLTDTVPADLLWRVETGWRLDSLHLVVLGDPDVASMLTMDCKVPLTCISVGRGDQTLGERFFSDREELFELVRMLARGWLEESAISEEGRGP
jgi:hypothetical protein